MSTLTTTALMAIATATRCVERTVQCSDGILLAARQWGQAPSAPSDGTARRILCLHGWLDNASSFHLVGPALVGECSPSPPVEVIAIDFPGHGLSSHKSPDGPSQLLAEYAYYVAEAASALGWWDDGDGRSGVGGGDEVGARPFSIVGHSMGAGVAVVFAAAFPERVDRMVLLEGAGPLARREEDVGRHLRSAIERRLRSTRTLYPNGAAGGARGVTREKNSGVRKYPSLEAAVEARMATARLSPGGRQYLSREGAEAMVRRATIPAPPAGEEGYLSENGGRGYRGPVSFRHDPRLQWPSLQYFTREQVRQLLRDVRCPVCLLWAEEGWPLDQRSKDDVSELLQPKIVRTLPGSHHFHADPGTAPAVTVEAAKFFKGE